MGIQVVEVSGAQGGLFMEQWFREEVVRFKITESVSRSIAADLHIHLAREDGEVVGAEPSQPRRGIATMKIEKYMEMREAAMGLALQFKLHCDNRRYIVNGDGWCWAYALSLAFGAEIDHARQVDRGERATEAPPTEHDKALVEELISWMQVLATILFAHVVSEKLMNTSQFSSLITTMTLAIMKYKNRDQDRWALTEGRSGSACSQK